jgi:hypothetical protein
MVDISRMATTKKGGSDPRLQPAEEKIEPAIRMRAHAVNWDDA